MTTLWRKAFRDFWRERARTAFVVLAIALGISAFAAVLSSYAILTRELDSDYLATNPASAVIRLDSIDDDLVKAILQNPEVSDAEPRRRIRGQIYSAQAQRNLVLFVVHDYGNIRVSKLVPQRGAWPPSIGEILIERDAFQVAKAKIGDAVTVKTANGVAQPLVVSGSAHDVGQAQARMENIVYGYINLATLVQLGEEPKFDELNLLVARNRFDENHVRRVVADVEALIKTRGHKIRRLDIPKPGQHPHSDLTGSLLLAMSSFGLFVLLLSGIIVINLLTAMMAAQVRQIGVMKAIGGTRRQIAGIYFGQALFLGIAAVIISLPRGIIGSRALCRYMAVFLNFDINSFAAPLWVYLLVALVGIAAPLIAAAYPVWRGTATPVRVALSSFGVGQSNFGTSRLDRALTRIGSWSSSGVFSIRNSFRRRARLVLTLLTLTAAGLFFLSALNIRASLIYTFDRMFAAKRVALTASLTKPEEIEKVDKALSNSRFAYDEHMLMIYVFLIVMSVIIGGVGGLGLMTTMSLNVLERRREMGVMRAIGATPKTIWLMIVAEGVVIGILSWIIAALLAWPVSKALGDLLVRAMFRSGMDFTFEPLGLLIWIVVSISLSAAASFLPAWKASRVTVREALAYE
ncbi:MAG TPA: FtsX-like permease family protein [Pyrinomonadaceae bacterium]|nr:FtsX-like permease family protein [Pyrinomonadaceae bacterium]